MENHSADTVKEIRPILRFILLIPCFLTLATVLVVNRELADGVISGKYFWFYLSMGILAVFSIITVIKNKQSLKFSRFVEFYYLCSIFPNELIKIKYKHMKIKRFISLLWFASFIYCTDVQAINNVKIVTIGGGGKLVSAGSDSGNPQKLVDRIIDYWKREFNKVLIYKPDLIVLSEACERPAGLNDREEFAYYSVRGNQVLDYFASVAKENKCHIAFGMKHEENGKWWNSCFVLDREGKVAGVYHKNYPTVYEMPVISPGTEIPLIQCDFGTVACAICFDLNFDELRDRFAALKPDIIVFPSNYHGGLEQAKWAYSCRSFFVGSYGFLTAPSEIRDPFGNVVATSTNHNNYAVATVNLDRKMVHLDFNRGKISALQRKYGDKVVYTDPGLMGVAMISSEHEQISAADMIKEFDIELLDDYFDRSRRGVQEHIKSK